MSIKMECLEVNCQHTWRKKLINQLYAATIHVSTTNTLCSQVEQVLDAGEAVQTCCPKCHGKCASSNPEKIHSCQSSETAGMYSCE